MRRLINLLPVLMILLLPLVSIQPAFALFEGAKDQACQGVALSQDPTVNGCDNTAASRVNAILTTAINTFSIVVGVITVIMIIIGGLKYITSSGDSANINSAKNTILYAIIGLVIVLFTQVFVRFVINRVSPACHSGTTLQADGTCK